VRFSVTSITLASSVLISQTEMMEGTVETSKSDPVNWVNEHGDFLYNYALGQLRDAGDAEDVVQETFLAALKAQDGFAGRSSERTWLVSILRRKVCDHFRRKYRERSVSCDSQPTKNGAPCIERSMLWVHETAAECLLPDRRMELNEFRSALESALGLLPARIAQAFAMYEVEEYPGREVCRRMEISETNLWVMLHRARKKLRCLLPCWRRG
jgi:RNA polymerase sigma-70 factor, ECF subfamily